MRRFVTALSLLLLLGGAVAHESVHAQSFPAPSPTTWRPLWPTASTTPSITTTSATTSPASQPAPAPRPGLFRCVAEENGVPASASVDLLQNGRSVARGSCANALTVPAGSYTATITLDTAIDRPTRSVPVVVGEGAQATARASFQTALLEVRFTDQRQPAYGIAELRRNGVLVGTVGNGVTARVSVGTYDVTARYRTQQRVFSVTLQANDRRALRAEF